MRVLITGANGFVGRHMARELQSSGHTPLFFDREGSDDGATTFVGDLCSPEDLDRVVAKARPDACVHLAGIAFIPASWDNPQLVFEVNLLGVLKLLDACRRHAPHSSVLVVTSAEIYKRVGISSASAPMAEDAPVDPSTPYAVAKAAADQMAILYGRRHGLRIMTARPGNHIGPGQSPLFVTASFARQLAQIKQGLRENKLLVGNLDSVRVFTDVRDVVRAYRLLLESGQIAEGYNIGSTRAVSIRFVLNYLCQIAGLEPEIAIDQQLYRAAEVQPTLAIDKIKKAVGWEPQISLETSLKDIYYDALERWGSKG